MDFSVARANMVKHQVRANRIEDPRVVRALSLTPREDFLPPRLRGIAYADEDLPLGGGRVMIEPMVLGWLLQAARITPADVVLAIGDPTGWASAVLSHLATTVVTLEGDPALAATAAANLTARGVDTVALVGGDPAQGYPAQAPYDVIVMAGAVAEIPPGIVAQLVDGGRLSAVVAPVPGTGSVVRLIRAGAGIGGQALAEAHTAYLPGLAPRPAFAL